MELWDLALGLWLLAAVLLALGLALGAAERVLTATSRRHPRPGRPRH